MAKRGKSKKVNANANAATTVPETKKEETKKEVVAEKPKSVQKAKPVEKIAQDKKNNNKNSKSNKKSQKNKKNGSEEKKPEEIVENEKEESDDEIADDLDIDAFISEQNVNDETENKEEEEDNEDNDEEIENAEESALDAIETLQQEMGEDEEEEKEQEERSAINNTIALNKRYNDIRLDTPGVKVPWIETQDITSNESLDIDEKTVHDDLKRELAFYEQALDAAKMGRKKYKELKKPFSRPDDYFAEMVKTDEQMNKIRQNLVEESESIKNAEAAKRQRDIRKYGKKVQTEKLLEKNKNKKMELEKIKNLKRKRSDNNDDDFDISLDFDNDNKQAKRGKNGKPQKSQKRMAKDKKFGFGGRKRNSKQNTAESSADMTGFSHKKMKDKPFGGNKKAKRPGKSRRMASRK